MPRWRTLAPRWGALWAVARAERRTGWRTLLLLGVLFGLVGGVVLGATALAARTATAYPRLVDAVGLDDARVLVAADQQELAAAVPTLPGVAQAYLGDAWIAKVDGPSLQFLSFTGGQDRPPGMLEPVVVAGRPPAPDAADELLIGEPLAERSGLGVGDEVTLRLLTLDEVSMFDVGFGEPDGPTVRLTVVGVGRMPMWGGALANAVTGPEFARRYGAAAVGTAAFVRLTDDPGAALVFSAAFRATAAAADARGPSIAARYLPPFVELPSTDVDPAVVTAERALVVGLAIFAVVLAGGGLLVVGQGVVRHQTGQRGTQRIESALGMGAGERVAARVLAAVPAALVAALLGAALAVAAGLLEPLGSQARFEPAPGFRPSVAVAAVGAAAVAVAFLAMVAISAATAGGRPRGRTQDDRPVAVAWGRRWPAVLVGVGLALRGRRAYRGVPAALTGIAAAVAVGGIVAAVVFGASLARLVEEPVRYGQVADLTVVDAREPDIARLAADPRIVALDVTGSSSIRLADGLQVPAVARTPRTGSMPSELTAGRAPGAPGEVAIGQRLAAGRALDVGGVLEVLTPAGGVASLTVTGIVVAAAEDSGHLGDVLLLTPGRLSELALGEPLVAARVLAAPGQLDALTGELAQRLEVGRRAMPDEVRNVADLLRLPEVLAGVLAAIAGAAIAHTLLTAARRHAREVAVLSVLGATPGQLRATLAVMAGATVAPALLLGIPLGIGIARVLWWQVATSIGVAGDISVPLRLLALTGGALLVGSLLLAVVPAARAPRRSAAAVLGAS